MSAKKETRRKMLSHRDSVSPEERAAASVEIEKRLFEFAPFVEAATVMFFVAFRSEVQTESMIRRSIAAGKNVVVPITQLETGELIPSELNDFDNDLKRGTYGVLEPTAEATRLVDPQKIDLVLMPGAAFDRQGGRVGYGGGYYDRFLARLRQDVVTAALAFSFQVIDEAPAEIYDRRAQFIITEHEVIDCR